uniref:F5/8 type C domain-containing protein n=1 Tax=Eutreptiella gymnastica TaxID=73025 RepID=A0A7S4GJL9_9EUGL
MAPAELLGIPPSPSAAGSPVAFHRLPVGGGKKHVRPKTGITAVDVEITILHRCLDRLLSRRLQKDALPPPNTVHAALSPILSPVSPLVTDVRELELDDPAVRFHSDGTVRADTPPPKTPPLLPPKGPHAPYTNAITFAELETEVNIMRRSLDNLVLLVSDVMPSTEARPNTAPDPFARNRSLQSLTTPLQPIKATPIVADPQEQFPADAETVAASSTAEGHTPALHNTSVRSAESAPASTPGRKAEEHGTAPGPLAATARPDGTFWGQVLKYCVYGIGTYHFNIGGVGNRLRLAKEAAKYGLHSLSDELFNYPKCVIVSKMIAYNPRSTDRQGPPLARIKAPTTNSQGQVVTGERTVGRECKGILHFVGTLYGTKQWQNPTQLLDRRLLDVKTSSTFGSGKAADAVSAHMGYLITQDRPQSWIMIDFCKQLVVPKCYSFASSHPMYAGYYPRNWELQGSMDAKHWVCLKRHVDDTTLNKFNPIGYWRLDGLKGDEDQQEAEGTPAVADRTFFRYFRLLQTGLNSFGTHEFQCSSFEIYGQLIYLSETCPLSAPPPAWDAQRNRSPGPVPDLPQPPKQAPPKAKAGKRK